MKKIFTLLTLALMSIGSAWADATDATIDFESGSLEDIFTITNKDGSSSSISGTDVTISGSNAVSKTAPTGSTKFLLCDFGSTKGANSEFVTKSSYTEISAISMYIVSSDRGKTEITIQVSPKADFSESVTNVQAKATLSDTDFGNTSNGSMKNVTWNIAEPVTGYVRVILGQVSTSNNKKMGIDNLKITYTPSGPTITQQPQSATYVTGYAATALHVAATASAGELSYQWYRCNDADKNGSSAISGDAAKAASYTPSTAAAGTFYYFCRVTDSNGSTDSNVATITVSEAAAPTISVSGAPVGDIVKGTAVTLTATVTGVPTPTIKWFSNTTASTSGAKAIAGATELTYSPSTATAGTYYYFAQAINSEGDAISSIITITVTDPDVYRTGYNSYYVAKNETPVGGARVLCDDITMVYDNVTYNKAGEDKMIESLNANYVASVSCSTNGWGVTFTPSTNGVLSVGVVINKNKTFSITNVTSFTYVGKRGATAEYDVPETVNGGNSWTTENDDDHKYWVIVTIDVVAGTSYKFSVAGSKMSLYGFEFVPTGATEAVSTLSGRNYGSYVPKATLDFGSAAGITAYIATGLNGAGDAVTMTAVDVVPAGTPIIVKTDTKGASVDVPVAAGATSNVSTNMLMAGDGSTAYNGVAGYDIYYLASDQFHKANAGTLQSGKAYLKVAQSSGAPSLALSFGGDNGTTAIESVEKAVKADGEFYNLNGQRVAQPTKGLYIVNGRKVIIK